MPERCVCAIGDAMASPIGKVWAFFINFGTQKANDPAEAAIISDVKSHISELRAAHDIMRLEMQLFDCDF